MLQCDISLRSLAGKLHLDIRDKGCGIPVDVIPKLFVFGATYGKKGGSGQGLYHAKRVIERMHGSIHLTSDLNLGTQVHIRLPLVDKPTWSVDKIDLTIYNRVVIIDDEEINAKIWQRKLESYPIKVFHYSKLDDVPANFLNNSRTLLLIDNSFGQRFGEGMHFLKSNHLAHAYLVTNDWFLPEIQDFVTTNNIKMLGKDLIPFLEVG